MKKNYPQVAVSKKAEAFLLMGHPWVYDTEVTPIGEVAEDGGLVTIHSQKGSFLGTGFYNSHSKIRVRVLSRNANDEINEKFFARRLRYAWEYRKGIMKAEDLDACRIIFGEADQMPGLTVDKFHDILVTQTLCLGMEKWKPVIFEALYQILKDDGVEIRGIFERNDVGIRELEGMEQGKGFYPLQGVEIPSSCEVSIVENGIRYFVDFENGQKTGFFLDQKYNRRAVAEIAKNKRVLDCFTHTGSFGLNAAKGGAQHVHAVDISDDAIKMAQRNAKENNLDSKMSFETANVFDLLSSLTPKQYDFIILDPPAFTKSRKTVEHAAHGYLEINERAMKLLPRGGYLATCSCSHFMTDELFRKMLREASSKACVSLRQIEERQQGPDHPILWNVPETDYLKFYLFQVV
ncbi:class I SAM-dependent rRNA methyltransferase [Caproicibacterium sp. NSD3]